MISPSEADVLGQLRKTTLAYLSDADFAQIEKAVERDGILSLQGSAATLVKNAVRKHGAHDQSSHSPKKGGGGAGGGGGKGATVGGVYLSDTVPIRGTVKLKDGSQIRGKITNNADRPTDIKVFEENPVSGKTSNISTRVPKINVSRIDTGGASIIDLTFPGGTFGD